MPTPPGASDAGIAVPQRDEPEVNGGLGKRGICVQVCLYLREMGAGAPPHGP